MVNPVWVRLDVMGYALWAVPLGVVNRVSQVRRQGADNLLWLLLPSETALHRLVG